MAMEERDLLVSEFPVDSGVEVRCSADVCDSIGMVPGGKHGALTSTTLLFDERLVASLPRLAPT